MIQATLLYYSEDLALPVRDQFEQSVREFSRTLVREPLGLQIRCEPVPAELVSAAREFFRTDNLEGGWGKLCDASRAFNSGPLPKFVFAFPPSHALARLATDANSEAKWGLAFANIALIYRRDCGSVVVFHECLHLLGAKDCYDREPGEPPCELGESCIMSYAPSARVLENWPFLCQSNCQRVRKIWRDEDMAP